MLIIVISLSGCVAPYRNPPVISGEPFAGIADVLKEKHSTPSSVDVVLIHGMCTHEPLWVAEANNGLAKALGSNQTFDKEAVLKHADPVDGKTVVYHLEIDIGNGIAVYTHSILWSPVTTPAKKSLCYDVKDRDGGEGVESICKDHPTPYGKKRASLNTSLKDQLVDDCFSDAILYSGEEMGGHIRNEIAQALLKSVGYRAGTKNLQALADHAAKEVAPLFFISESLGSKILFDTLLEMLGKRKPSENKTMMAPMSKAAQGTIERTWQVFMDANQIPLLSLACITPQGKVPKDSWDTICQHPLQVLGEVFSASGKKGQELARLGRPQILKVVAFTDPNDLLSFPLKDSHLDGGTTYKLTDVTVSNANTYFGIWENPLSAHQGYRKNEDVNKCIAFGYPTAQCP